MQYYSSGILASIETTSPAIGGNNTITAGNGNNIIFGGAGANTITTGAGNQIVFGHHGEIDYQSSGRFRPWRPPTRPWAAATRSTLGDTAGGTDYIFGGPGNNQITMGNGNAYIIGASGQIEFYSGSSVVETVQSTDPDTGGNDTIQTGDGNHTIIGGDGANTISVGNGNNTIIGDNGTVQYYSSGILASIETTNPTIGGNNTITAGNGNNIIFGGPGIGYDHRRLRQQHHNRPRRVHPVLHVGRGKPRRDDRPATRRE